MDSQYTESILAFLNSKFKENIEVCKCSVFLVFFAQHGVLHLAFLSALRFRPAKL